MAHFIVPAALVIGGGAAALGGAAAGTAGSLQIGRARKRVQRQTEQHEARHVAHLRTVARTNAALRSFGDTQARAQEEVVHRMRDFLVRHAKQVRAHECAMEDPGAVFEL